MEWIFYLNAMEYHQQGLIRKRFSLIWRRYWEGAKLRWTLTSKRSLWTLAPIWTAVQRIKHCWQSDRAIWTRSNTSSSLGTIDWCSGGGAPRWLGKSKSQIWGSPRDKLAYRPCLCRSTNWTTIGERRWGLALISKCCLHSWLQPESYPWGRYSCTKAKVRR